VSVSVGTARPLSSSPEQMVSDRGGRRTLIV
jgi:hypothetical protein